jgi:tetratricopeptide (TPR) repeat protein
LHLKAAAALEACYPDQPEYMSRIAQHYRMAREFDQAAEYAMRAVHRAPTSDLAAALRMLDSIPREELPRELRLNVLMTLSQAYDGLRDEATAARYFEEAMRHGLPPKPTAIK